MRYTKPVVTWKILNDTKWLTPEYVKAETLNAFNKWAKVILNLSFAEETDPAKTADISIKFDSNFHMANAVAYSNPNCIFDEKQVWGTSFGYVNAHLIDPVNYPKPTMLSLVKYSFPHVIIHEIGHSIGLPHTYTDSQSVMYPYGTAVVYLSKGDITNIQAIYGVRPIIVPPRVPKPVTPITLPPVTPQIVLPTPRPDPIWTPPTPIIPDLPPVVDTPIPVIPVIEPHKCECQKHIGLCCVCCTCKST